VHRDRARGCIHIDSDIEEVEEDPMESTNVESTKDETYRMSPMPPSENGAEEDDESNGSWARHEAVEEEEGRIEGSLNPRSRRRNLFDPSPTIHILHMSLWYVVANCNTHFLRNKI
jgi:hypothetical protein